MATRNRTERTDPTLPTHHNTYLGIAALEQADVLCVRIRGVSKTRRQKFVRRAQRGVIFILEHKSISLCPVRCQQLKDKFYTVQIKDRDSTGEADENTPERMPASRMAR